MITHTMSMYLLLSTAPRSITIKKWRLSYSEACQFAHEIYEMRDPASVQSIGDIIVSIADGNTRAYGIPVELR